MDDKMKLLDDSPAESDAFGAHQRIASAVLQLVKKETGGKAIALIGRWGSGKSTVVRLAQNAAPDDVGVFVFDAWGHQGDPLRRTFLEEFCNFLEKEEWLGKDFAKEIRDELSGRYKECTTTTTPHLTNWGVAFGFALFAEAVGLAMLSGGNSPPWWVLLGFFLTLSIPLVGAAVLARNFYRKWRGKSAGQNGADFLGLLMKKQVEKTSTITISTPEPTSVEFQQKFGQVAEKALSSDKRLLLVIDNLDRVDPHEAMQLWSVMRTFIDFQILKEKSWAESLWVMAAFDDSRVGRLWGNEPGKKSESNGNGGGDLSTAFLEKTFQIQFKVPAPLLLDWRAFLDSQLKAVLPDISEDDLYKVGQVFATTFTEGDPPTPRNIKLFVNQLVATERTLADQKIPLAQQALHAILAGKDRPPEAKNKILDNIASNLGPDWEANEKALHYGATKEQVSLLKFGPAMELALFSGDPEPILGFAESGRIKEALAEFSGRRIPEWKKHDPEKLARFAYLLNCDTLKNKYSPAIDKQLRYEIVSVNEWPNLDAVAGKGIAAILPHLEKNPLAELLGAISKPPIVKPDQPLPLEKWVAGVEEVLRAVECASGQESLAKNFRIRSTAQQYCEVLAKAGENLNDRSQLRNFRPELPPGEIVAILNAKTSKRELGATDESAVRYMQSVDVKWPWEKLSELGNILRNPQPGSSALTGRCANIMLLLRSNAQIRQQIGECTKSGFVLLNLAVAKATGDNSGIAGLILLHLIGNPVPSEIQNPSTYINNQNRFASDGSNHYLAFVRNPNQDTNLLNELTEIAKKSEVIGELLEIWPENSQANPTIKAIVVAIADKSPEVIPPALIVAHYSTLREIDAKTTESLIDNYAANETMNGILIKTTLTLKNCDLFRQVLARNPTNGLKNNLASSLELLPTETWQEDLRTGGKLVPLLRELQKSSTNLEIGHHLQDAMTIFFKQTADKGLPAEISIEDWERLAGSLKQAQRATLARNMVQTLITAGEAGHSLSGLISLAAKTIGKGHELSEKADDIVRVTFKTILTRQDETEYSWMAKVFGSAPDFIGICKPETLKDFKARAEEMCKGGISDQCRAILNAMLDQLDPNRQSPPPERNPPPEK